MAIPFSLSLANKNKLDGNIMDKFNDLIALSRLATASKEIFSLANCNTAFGLDMFKQLAANLKESNIFFSPYSIYYALAMVSLGAKNETLRQLRETMKLEDIPEEQVHELFAKLNEIVFGSSQECILNSANRLYGEKTYKFLEEFLEDCKKYYGAGLAAVDFKGDHDACRREINGWVSDRTKDKIKDLLKPGTVSEMTRLISVNAVYFKGEWIKKFRNDMTKEEDFHVTPDRSVKVKMMHMSKETLVYGYSKKLQCQFLELPYAGFSISMVVLLPDLSKTTLEELESSLSSESLNGLRGRRTGVNVWLPRFKMEQDFKLQEALRELGARDLFIQGEADLSGISSARDLCFSDVIHKAFIEVNEQGTEAAAATAMVMVGCSFQEERPEEFRADHPFVFLLKDSFTSTVLFLGRVHEP